MIAVAGGAKSHEVRFFKTESKRFEDSPYQENEQIKDTSSST
jgi:hypothetical protein